MNNLRLVRPRDEEGWISATQTHDYFLGDPLLSFLKSRKNFNYRPGKSHLPSTYIMEQGNIFEQNIVARIRKQLGTRAVVTVAEGHADALSDRKAAATLRLMRKGTPVIHSAVLQNPDNKTFGVADLVIRSDYLNRIIKEAPELTVGGCRFSDNWYYLVIDIKYSSLKLTADGIHLLNSGRIPAYKAQLLVYNLALEYFQGYRPDKAFVLGRKWSYTQRNITREGIDPLDRLGVINYTGVDKEYLSKLTDCLSWLSLVNSDTAKQWSLDKYPLAHDNLYPNMNNRYDSPWRKLKNDIATANGEITALWMSGPKNRKLALQRGICSWKDRRCKASTLGINGKYRSGIVNKILKVNRQSKRLILPDRLQDDQEPWLKPASLEFFIDFETWNGAIDTLDNSTFANKDQICYFIGVMDSKGKYKKFVADRLTFQHEGHMVREFVKYLKHRISRSGVNETEVNIYHWSQAEPIWWGYMKNRHHMSLFCNWIDLLEIFQTEPIVVKGALTYSLKDIAGAMYNNGMITTTWADDTDALATMVLAQQANDYACATKSSIVTTEEIAKISRYNEVDVRVLYEIISYLRSKYQGGRKCRRLK